MYSHIITIDTLRLCVHDTRSLTFLPCNNKNSSAGVCYNRMLRNRILSFLSIELHMK